MLQIGFIGLGIMGRSMAGHLQRAGHALHVYNRSRGGAQPLLEGGAAWHESPASLASCCEIVVTMVGTPADVEELYLGDGAIVEHSRPGTVLIDMTTSSPGLAVRVSYL